MEKIELGTADGATENIEKIAELFPQVMTETKNAEGELERVVDFDALRDLLGDVAEGQRERYQFTWPGKREAKAEARRPIYKTMIPEPGKSKDWDTTENLYIEGDNLDALKILKETYAGKVKLIYIDPPYNTGGDTLIYPDNYSRNAKDFENDSGNYNENGMRVVANLESNGRFHSDWCSDLYPKLLVARDLLKADGVIAISIGEGEVDNAIKIADEVFSRSNRVFLASRAMKLGGAKGKFYTPSVDYVLFYAKDITRASYFRAPFTQDQIDVFYKQTETEGAHKGELYGEERLFKASLDPRPNQRYFIQCPDGSFVIPPGVSYPNELKEGITILPTSEDKVWKWIYPRFKQELEDGRIVFKKTGTSSLVDEKGNPSPWNIYNKLYLSEQEEKGVVPSNLLLKFENRQSSKELKALGIPFDYAKPLGLIKYICQIVGVKRDDIVLDFFSGSATTAHAVFDINQHLGSSVRFIMVQYPEAIDADDEAGKAGYKTICEIGEERIRRAGAKIAAGIDKENEQLELGADPKPYPDLGFRVLRIDSSNFKDFYLTPGETSQESLFDFADNVKEGRSDLDLLFEVLPKLGIPYSAKIEERMLAGRKVFFVDGDKLAACFDENVGSDTIEEMAKAKPWYAVIRDSSMADDATHANYEELFRTYSPDTVPQVI